MESSLRSHLTVLGLVIAVIAAVFAVGYTHPIRLGLDLQGGLEVVLEAQPTKQRKVTPEQLSKSLEIIRKRVDSLGVSEPEIRTQGEDQIAIELPGEKDPARAVALVGSTAQLHFYDFQEVVVGGKAYRTAYDLLKRYEPDAKKSLQKASKRLDDATARQRKATTGRGRDAARSAVKDAAFDQRWYLFDADQKQVAGPAPGRQALLDKYASTDGEVEAGVGRLPKGFEALMVPVGQVMVHGDPDRVPVAVAQSGGRFDKDQGVFMLFEDRPALSGSDIRSATGESRSGSWVTSIIFTGKGGRAFQDVTRDIAKSGARLGAPLSFAIVLDDEIKSAPTIDYTKNPLGIAGGAAEITGLDSREEAQDLALVLNTGALPVRFEVISKSNVSATLGSQSLQQGLLAGAAGLAVVMVYLIIFYRFLGLIADIALLIYAFIFYGLVVGIPITMTLPGIAGMILTIAVAADANIIIFERIREEYRAGRSVSAAVHAGYNKGLRTIVDANVVTMITALVLFIIATGTVRGFALLLFVGTVLSMFTAVAATYAMLGLLTRVPVFRNRHVLGLSRRHLRINIRWMRARNLMLAFTAAIIAGSLLLVGTKGLTLGVDFRSGTKFDVVLKQHNVPIEGVRKTLEGVDGDYRTATIKKTEQPNAGRSKRGDTSSFTINIDRLATKAAEGKSKQARANNANEAATAEVYRALRKQYGLKSGSDTTIGPSFGKQVRNGAIVAIVVSLLLEVIYISMRFEAKYAIPVMVALLHDVAVALGAYALTGREFKSATVAALLTILGYSLYDTIIVFDRIRENIGVLRKSSFTRIVDASLNEVITRSFNTTLVVLGPISALYFFGGETLKDFAYALIIGIFAGAYSSVIVASPILCLLKEREPAWQRRAEGRAGARRATAVDPGASAVAASNVAADDAELAGSTAVPDGRSGAPEAHSQRRRDRRSRAQRKR